MQPIQRRRLALALIFVTPALWGTNYLVARSAPGAIEPHALALLRWSMACVLFALSARAELWACRRNLLDDWKHCLVLGALGMWVCGAWVYIGGRSTGAVNIALIYSIAPVLIVLGSVLWLRERIRPWQALGVALALAGVVHVVIKGRWDSLAQVQFVPGDAWIVGATLSWAVYSVLLKKWPSALGSSARLALISFFGVLVIAPFAVVEAILSPLPVLTAGGFGLALAAALLPGYGAYLAYSVMQRELGAARVGTVLYLGPIYAAAMAWLVLGEPLYAYHAAGLTLVLPGIYLAMRRGG